MRDRLTASQWWPGIFLGLGSILVTVSVVLASGGGHEAAHGAAHGGHAITPEKIQDFMWRTLNFVVFAAILVKLAAKPAKAFFSKRSSEIGESLEDLEAKKAEAEAALKAAETRLAEVAGEREKLMEQFIAEGEAEKKKIIDKAEMVATRIKEMAEFSIQQETKKAAQELKQEVAEKATQMAEALIQKEITSTDQTKLVEEYLHKVVEKH
jgi:F-type H+-transporting ATPase subunit b